MLFESGEPDNKPQTLLFSATVPSWVQKTARKYLRSDIVKLDLVGRGTVRTATSVQVEYRLLDLIDLFTGLHLTVHWTNGLLTLTITLVC